MPSPSSYLDLSRAQEFAQDAALLRELVVSFEPSLAQEMTRMQTGLAAADFAQVNTALHTLKGFVSLCACEAVSEAVAALYLACGQQSLAVTGEAWAALMPQLEALLIEIRAWLAPL